MGFTYDQLHKIKIISLLKCHYLKLKYHNILQQQSVTPQQQGKRHRQIPKQKHAHQQQLSKGTDSAISNKNIPLKRQKTASVNALTTKIYEEKLKLPPQMELVSCATIKGVQFDIRYSFMQLLNHVIIIVQIRPSDNMTNLLEPCQLHMLQTAAVSGPPSGYFFFKFLQYSVYLTF